MSSGCVIAIDPGTKRVGVAVSDPSRSIAFPLGTIERKDDSYIDEIIDIAQDREAATIVVGLAKSMDSSEGPSAQAARILKEKLEALTSIPVILMDERLTTVSAERALRSAEVGGRKRRGVVDQTAAAILLQSYLDQEAGR